MKRYSRIILLVAAVLVLTMTACLRQASTPAASTPTGGAGDVPFPVSTQTVGSVADFGTQTAIAQTPQADRTPQVVVNTPATDGVDQGGGQGTPADPNAAPTSTDGDQGGGQGQDPQAAAPTQAPAAPAAPVVRPASYTLQAGEFPYCIARRYDLDPISFLSANGMTKDSKPLAGTTMRVPTTGNWGSAYGSRTLRAHPADYTVVAGDTVYTIACKYGDVTPEAILQANGLSQPSGLTVGSTIRIP